MIKKYVIYDKDNNLECILDVDTSSHKIDEYMVDFPEMRYSELLNDEPLYYGFSKLKFTNTGVIIDNDNSAVREYLKKLNRSIRPMYLQAFDLWEKAVVRGREEDSSEIMQWYKDMLDLKPEAFKDENIPDRITYYLGGK